MAIAPGRRQEPLLVVPMALGLVLAAFTGAALGLVWQSSGLGSEDDPATAETARLTATDEGE